MPELKEIRKLILERFESVCETPGMWGGPEHIEFSLLGLIESLQWTYRTDRPVRELLDTYIEFCSKNYKTGNQPLFIKCDGDYNVICKALTDFKNIQVQIYEMWEESDSVPRRASGEVICTVCGKPYKKHFYTLERDWNDEPFLTALCDGTVVKL